MQLPKNLLCQARPGGNASSMAGHMASSTEGGGEQRRVQCGFQHLEAPHGNKTPKGLVRYAGGGGKRAATEEGGQCERKELQHLGTPYMKRP